MLLNFINNPYSSPMQSQEYPEDIDIQKYWLILKRHWLPATLVWLLTVGLATYAAFSVEEKYAAYGKLRLKKESTTSALVTEIGEKIGTLDSLNMQDTPLDTEAVVIKSGPIVEQTINDLNITTEEGELISYDNFTESLGVKGIPGTDVLTLSYTSKDPEEARAVVDKIMELYIENNVSVNRTEAVSAREFISEQLPRTEQELLQAEQDLRRFKEKYNIINLEQESNLAVQSIESLENKIDLVQSQLDKITARTQELQSKLEITSKEALTRNALSESASVQQTLGQLNEIENELASARTYFVDQAPEIIVLENQKAALEALLRNRTAQVVEGQPVTEQDFHMADIEKGLAEQLVLAEVERKALIQELQSLEQVKLVHEQRSQILPSLEQQKQELERKVEAAKTAYTVLIDRLQQVRIAENQNVGNAQIINPAIISPYPVSTSKKVIVGLGVVVGSALYVITAFILELLDRSIKTSQELRNIFSSYTLLGMIPNCKKGSGLGRMKLESVAPEHQVRDAPRSIISEAYRMLQANLKFISPDRQINTIVVTSAVSLEGKSTVSANLAEAIAELGNRVLLIDADLHHPQQHHIWNLTNEVGLSDVIVNPMELSKAIKPVMSNLHILPSGVIPPNSLALLDSKRMRILIEDFRKIYDFVIIDTSPLLLVADALTLGKNSDGVLLVARPKIIDSVSASAAKDLLSKSNQNVLGLVTNAVEVANEPDSYFHYAKSYFKDQGSARKADSYSSSERNKLIQR